MNKYFKAVNTQVTVHPHSFFFFLFVHLFLSLVKMYNTIINAQLQKRVKNKVLFQQELKDLAMSMPKFKNKIAR